LAKLGFLESVLGLIFLLGNMVYWYGIEVSL